MNGKIIISLASILSIWSHDVLTSDAIARAIFDDTFKKFTWVSDMEQFGVIDKKVSFAKQVKKGLSFKGDCDDFAYTMRDLLNENGYETELHSVRTYNGNMRGKSHMVLKATKDGESLMIDNRYPDIRGWEVGMNGSRYTNGNAFPKALYTK
jgi:predicted transglutaminase-like cysteine proteinase